MKFAEQRKIAFFDIDGTLTSELDSSIPESAADAIRRARANGHLMFINTGRCMQNVEKRFLDVGFDGVISGCGTNIYYEEDGVLREALYVRQSHSVTREILEHSRKFELDILFESKKEVVFDTSRPLITEDARKLQKSFIDRSYDMSHSPDSNDFTCDKFVIWMKDINKLPEFTRVSGKYFTCIDRGANFREFVPNGYSKATGIREVLKHYGLTLDNAYALGDSNNDLAMLEYVKHSIAMGNAESESLLHKVSYVTTKASEDGIKNALEHYQFI